MSGFVDLNGAIAVAVGAGAALLERRHWRSADAELAFVVSDVLAECAESVAVEIVAAGGRAVGAVCDVERDEDLAGLRDADEAGEKLVAAIEAGQFSALPRPTVHDERCERVDFDAYLTRFEKRSP